MKKRLLNGETIELENDNDMVSIWFNDRTSCFCLMLNAKVVKATKTWKPIQDKIDSIGDLEEVAELV